MALGLCTGGSSSATSYRYSPGEASIAPVLASDPRLPYLPRTDRTVPVSPTNVESTGYNVTLTRAPRAKSGGSPSPSGSWKSRALNLSR